MANEMKSAGQEVLVVDDDHDVAMVLEQFLKEAGYVVDVAYDGMDALSQMHSHNYDAVVCDVVMGRMSGDALYREVERTEPWMAPRFLFVTGMAGTQDFRRFLSQTGARVVEKPFHPEEILAIISEIIAENKD